MNEIHDLYIKLDQVQKEKDYFRDNMIGDRVFLDIHNDSKDPWDKFECQKRQHYTNDDGKIYSQLISQEMHLQKLIARKEKQYYWSKRRFKKNNY